MQDTLPAPLGLEIEESFFVEPGGIALLGWMFNPNDQPMRLSISSGARSTPLDPARLLPLKRKDVQDSLAARFGTEHAELGYLAYFPDSLVAGEQIWLDITLSGDRRVRRSVPAPALPPLQAMRRILTQVEFPYGMTAPSFDQVLGPVIQGLNRQRLVRRPNVTEFVFGPQRQAACSIVVPLHRRLDLMHYQLALLSEHGPGVHELIYVLDDPPLRREAEQLAASAYARLGLPFRLLTLDRNVGFAPAVNIGAAAARSQYLCLMNSDVFPVDATWLPRMLIRLQADPGLGVVAPVLLFEDGTLQHAGCVFEKLPQYSGWPFPLHPGKGLRPPPPQGLLDMPAVTGACMVLRHADWEAVGGFGEDYAIGDFEDADLCRKLQARGLRCAVDTDARLFHLERRSQAAPSGWRHNLTLFNAWTFQLRWGG